MTLSRSAVVCQMRSVRSVRNALTMTARTSGTWSTHEKASRAPLPLALLLAAGFCERVGEVSQCVALTCAWRRRRLWLGEQQHVPRDDEPRRRDLARTLRPLPVPFSPSSAAWAAAAFSPTWTLHMANKAWASRAWRCAR